MLIIIVTISILGISAIAWFANRILPIRVCPVCAGVAGTWLGLLAVHFAGYRIDLAVPAILMGGSVVGIAFQLEQKLPAESAGSDGIVGASWRTPLLWKMLFVPAGFIAAYSVLEEWWGVLLIMLAYLALLSLFFLSGRKDQKPRDRTLGELKRKMQKCC